MQKHVQDRKRNSRDDTFSRAQALQSQEVQLYRERVAQRCAIDKLIDEFVESGVIKVGWTRQQIRDAIDQRYAYAFQMANDVLIRWPAECKQVERLFSDLAVIKGLLKRNRALPESVLGSWIGNLEASKGFFESANVFLETIEKFIDRHEEPWRYEKDYNNLQQRNFDPFTFFFIEGIFCDVWSKLRSLRHRGLKSPLPTRADLPLLSDFLNAAWMDLGLPLHDHRGRSREPLREWLADRVRKHFRNLDDAES
jgi:hypothetical protein